MMKNGDSQAWLVFAIFSGWMVYSIIKYLYHLHHELSSEYNGLSGWRSKLITVGAILFVILVSCLGVHRFFRATLPDADAWTALFALGLVAATGDIITTLRRERKQLLVYFGAYRLFAEVLLESEANRERILNAYRKNSLEAFVKNGDRNTANTELIRLKQEMYQVCLVLYENRHNEKGRRMGRQGADWVLAPWWERLF